MGYSTIIGHAVLFTLVLVAVGFLLGGVNDYLTETAGDVEYQQESLRSQLETEVALTSVSYDATDYYIRATNAGKTTMQTECLDVYVDREFIPKSNYSVTLLNTTYDPDLWNQDEEIEIDAWWSPEGGTREIKVVTCNGVTDSKLVIVS